VAVGCSRGEWVARQEQPACHCGVRANEKVGRTAWRAPLIHAPAVGRLRRLKVAFGVNDADTVGPDADLPKPAADCELSAVTLPIVRIEM
jgi:hypothetical protein